MKSNAPWSVKGIARDTRETAKEAARREGMTVGEWLNQIINQAGQGTLESGGDVEGLQAKDLITAIEHLTNKVSDQDKEAEKRLGALNQNLGGIIERIQRVERRGSQDGAAVPDDLADRIEKLEQKTSDRDRIEALRALEKAVGQIAVQFDNAQKTTLARIEASEAQQVALAQQIEQLKTAPNDDIAKAVPVLQNSIDALSGKLSKLESKVAAVDPGSEADPHFAERTGKRLRVLGDEIKRGGDQVRSLETMISRLADQIDASEQRSAGELQKVTETVTAIQAQLVNRPSDNAAADSDLNHKISSAVTDAIRERDEKISSLEAAMQVATDTSPVSDNNSAATTNAQTDESHPEAHDMDVGELASHSSQSDDSCDLESEDFGESFSDLATAAIAEAPQEEEDLPETQVPLSATPQGSLDEDHADEISLDSDFGSAYDDLDFTDPDDDTTTSDLDHDDDMSVPLAGDITVDLDAEADDEANRISAEINQLLQEDQQVTPEQSATATGIDALDELENTAETSDPFHAPHETIATPPAQDLETESLEGAGTETEPHDDEQVAAAPETEEARTSQPSPGKLPRTADGRIDVARLTPKQKAILAARARKKRKEKKATSPQQTTDAIDPGNAERKTAKDGDNYQSYDERNRDELERPSLMSRVTGLFSKNKQDEDAPIADEIDQASITKKKEGLINNVDDGVAEKTGEDDTAHPVKPLLFRDGQPTMPLLAAAAILIVCLAVFLVRPFLPGRDTQQTPQTASREVAPEESTPLTQPNNDVALETPAVESGIVRPRQLFLESMATLNASDEAEGNTDTTTTAFKNLEKAASLGYPPAQFQLGEFYKNGSWTEQNAVRARTWFQRSAAGGNIYAMHRLGYLYAEGEGGSADILTAISWFEQAANHGFVDSQYNLGAIFDPGPGNIPQGIQDTEKSYYWYALAALNGDRQAGNKAAEVSARLSPEQKAQADLTIADWRALPVDVSANENLSEG